MVQAHGAEVSTSPQGNVARADWTRSWCSRAPRAGWASNRGVAFEANASTATASPLTLASDIVEKDGPIVTWGAGAASEAAPALARVTAVATLRQHRGKKKGAGIGRAQKVPKEEDENTERDRPMPSPLILQERCQEPVRPKSTSYGIVPVLEVS